MVILSKNVAKHIKTPTGTRNPDIGLCQIDSDFNKVY